MIQDPNVERLIRKSIEPLNKQISMLQIELNGVKEQLAIPRVSVSLPSLEDYKELLEASKQAYTSIRHETNPSNTQLDAYFRLEKILKTIKGNER